MAKIMPKYHDVRLIHNGLVAGKEKKVGGKYSC